MATTIDEQLAEVYALVDELGTVTERLRRALDTTTQTMRENEDHDHA